MGKLLVRSTEQGQDHADRESYRAKLYRGATFKRAFRVAAKPSFYASYGRMPRRASHRATQGSIVRSGTPFLRRGTACCARLAAGRPCERPWLVFDYLEMLEVRGRIRARGAQLLCRAGHSMLCPYQTFLQTQLWSAAGLPPLCSATTSSDADRAENLQSVAESGSKPVAAGKLPHSTWNSASSRLESRRLSYRRACWAETIFNDSLNRGCCAF